MADAPKFELGTVVQHKAGGPKMVVIFAPSETESTCRWFSGSKSEVIVLNNFELAAVNAE
jgi:uncharacterized protein YodC (DUF2158 family)